MSSPIPPSASSQYDTAEKTTDYQYYFSLLKKNLNFVLTFLMIGVSLSAIHVSRLPNQYTAAAQILLEKTRGAGGNSPSSQLLPDIWADDYYATQKEIMVGSTVLRQVIDELKLVDYFHVPDVESALLRAKSYLSIVRIRDSRLFNVVVKSPNGQFSMNLSNAVARAYIRKNFEDLLYFSKELLSWVPKDGEEVVTVEDPFGKMKQVSRRELMKMLPSVQTDPTVRGLEEKKNGLQAELTTLLKQYKEKHPLVVKAQASLRFLEESIESEKQRVIETLKEQAEGKLQISNARIVEEATAPKSPSGPARLKMVLTTAATELFMLLVLILLWDYFDDTIHSPEDLRRRGVNVPFLGPIPLIKASEIKEEERILITHFQKKSQAAESFRFLRVAINFSAPAETLKVLVFTSSIPSEGKSFIANNVAVSLAQDGNRTLLIDADLRRPRAHHIYKLENQTGLSNYLTSDIEFDSVVKETFVENLWTILSGPVSPNPAEILGSKRMETLLHAARERFDRIIVDSPPLAGMGDALVLGKITTHVVFVIRSGKTPVDVILHSKELLEKSSVRMIGCVLNHVDIEKERYGGYYKYYYQSYEHYGKKSD